MNNMNRIEIIETKYMFDVDKVTFPNNLLCISSVKDLFMTKAYYTLNMRLPELEEQVFEPIGYGNYKKLSTNVKKEPNGDMKCYDEDKVIYLFCNQFDSLKCGNSEYQTDKYNKDVKDKYQLNLNSKLIDNKCIAIIDNYTNRKINYLDMLYKVLVDIHNTSNNKYLTISMDLYRNLDNNKAISLNKDYLEYFYKNLYEPTIEVLDKVNQEYNDNIKIKLYKH